MAADNGRSADARLAVGLSTWALLNRLTALPPASLHDGRPYSDPVLHPVEFALVAAARFARDSLPGPAILATTKPANVYWFSGHRTVPLRRLLEAGVLPGVFDTAGTGADAVVLTPLLSTDLKYATKVLAPRCRDLELLVRTGQPPSYWDRGRSRSPRATPATHWRSTSSGLRACQWRISSPLRRQRTGPGSLEVIGFPCGD